VKFLSHPQAEESGGRGNNDNASFRPLWSEKQYRFKADKIGEWISRLTDSRGRPLRPGDEDFDVKFEADWQMSYDYWISQRERHEEFFLAHRGAS
jgi:hypothetical protein